MMLASICMTRRCSALMLNSGKAMVRQGVARQGVNPHWKLRGRMHMSTEIDCSAHRKFLEDVAKIEVPKGFDGLMKVLPMMGEEIVSPNARQGLIPFLVPLSKNKETGDLLCYIRWPTQKEEMELQLVRTTEAGVRLQSMNTVNYLSRLAVELDFGGNAGAAEAVDLAREAGSSYVLGDYVPFLKSGKFPAITKQDLRLVLDRYLLTKVGPFPDCYERLATNFLESGNEVSALVTCERAVSVFFGWGHPIQFHTNMLTKVGRDKEAKDSARASMGMPAWTVANTKSDLEEAAKCAGFTGANILGEMHFFRANDKREEDVKGGLSPVQVTLDQAAHLMDAVALGTVEGGWDAIREELAGKYRDGGYPQMADFIMSV